MVATRRVDLCTGPVHEKEGAGYYCPLRPDRWPEDGDWEAWCAECRAGYERHEELRGDLRREDA